MRHFPFFVHSRLVGVIIRQRLTEFLPVLRGIRMTGSRADPITHHGPNRSSDGKSRLLGPVIVAVVAEL